MNTLLDIMQENLHAMANAVDAASKLGVTSSEEDIERAWDTLQQRYFRILGFPCLCQQKIAPRSRTKGRPTRASKSQIVKRAKIKGGSNVVLVVHLFTVSEIKEVTIQVQASSSNLVCSKGMLSGGA